MKHREYDLVPYEKDQYESVARLQKFLWEEDVSRNVQHLKWKYHDNPYCKEPLAFVAKFGEEIVGFMGIIPTSWRIEGSTFEFLSFGDGCIHPDHRRKGLYSNLIKGLVSELQGSHYQGYLNLSSNEIMTPVLERLGWISIKNRTYLKKVDYFRMIMKRSFKPNEDGNIRSGTEPRKEEMIRCDEKMEKNVISMLKDGRFYDWRFQSGRRRYHFYYRYENEKMAGYIVVLDMNGSGRIIDHSYDRQSTYFEILEKIIGSGYYSMLLFMDVNMDPSLKEGMGKLKFKKKHIYDSFMKKKGETHISYRPLAPEYKDQDLFIGDIDLRDISNWGIKEIASDGV